MHGLINRSIERFLKDTYGAQVWQTVATAAQVPACGFEAMLRYDDALTLAMLDQAAKRLAKPRAVLLDDLGAFLVTLEPLRRLLRFGGVDYPDFLLSLEELPARARMALPELELPQLLLSSVDQGRHALLVRGAVPGWGAVVTGLLRAMADDYGALALIELQPAEGGLDLVCVDLLEARFASGRRFDLAMPQVPT
jgi:hypothetical protein